MQYFLITYENEKFYVEVDSQNTPLRQIIVDKKSQFHISCREDCLAEGEININDLEGKYEIIQCEKFEFVWLTSIQHYRKEWEQTKSKYTIGKKVKGYSSFFYPQGVIVKGCDFYAVYNNLMVNFINQKVEAKVKGYDEKNMWLIIE